MGFSLNIIYLTLLVSVNILTPPCKFLTFPPKFSIIDDVILTVRARKIINIIEIIEKIVLFSYLQYFVSNGIKNTSLKAKGLLCEEDGRKSPSNWPSWQNHHHHQYYVHYNHQHDHGDYHWSQSSLLSSPTPLPTKSSPPPLLWSLWRSSNVDKKHQVLTSYTFC